MIAHLGHAVFLLLIRHLPSGNVRFQALVEVDHASDRVGNGEDDKDDCDNRYIIRLALKSHMRKTFFMELTKSCQTSPCRFVVCVIWGLVHPDQLEDEVSQCGEQNPYNESHGDFLLPPGAPSREDQECDGEREDSNREVEFVVFASTRNLLFSVARGRGNDNNKLDGETNEEEEIEFKQSDENLK